MKKAPVSFIDFQKTDLRVGEVLHAEKVKESRNLVRMEVDLGSDYGTRKILAGLAEHIAIAKLKGKKFIFAANLEPKKMMGEESEGMILVADFGDELSLVQVKNAVKNGSVMR